MTQKPSKRILAKAAMLGLVCATLAYLGVCRKTGHYRTFVSEGKEFACEIPRDWEIGQSRGFILDITSPDAIEMVPAYMDISQQSKPQTIETLRETVEHLKKHFTAANDPDFIQELETIHFSSFTGLKYSATRTTGPNFCGTIASELSGSNKESTTPHPKPVLEKYTWVYFNTPEGQYRIAYSAPIAVYEVDKLNRLDRTRKTPADMYEKHRPEFEHLLNTFRWIKKAKPAK